MSHICDTEHKRSRINQNYSNFFVEKILELSSNFRLYMREIIFGGSRILDKFDRIFST